MVDAVVPTALRRSGGRFALATVVATVGSAPQPVGTAMAVLPDGSPVGSISGGCLESDVYERALATLGSGRVDRVTYRPADDDLGVGLTCGGIVDVVVERVTATGWPAVVDLVAALDAGEPVAVVTDLAGPDGVERRLCVRSDGASGGLGDPRLDATAADVARTMTAEGRSGLVTLGGPGAGPTAFVQVHPRPPRMLVFGSSGHAAAMVEAGRLLGYRVTVCDNRAVFTTPERFPSAHEVVVDRPERYLADTEIDVDTVVCVMTHDRSSDVALVRAALRSPAGYVGALGSRATHRRRIAALRDAGATTEELARLSSPIGLDLAARTPQETAVAVAAEVVAGRRGGACARQSPVAPSAPVGRA